MSTHVYIHLPPQLLVCMCCRWSIAPLLAIAAVVWARASTGRCPFWMFPPLFFLPPLHPPPFPSPSQAFPFPSLSTFTLGRHPASHTFGPAYESPTRTGCRQQLNCKPSPAQPNQVTAFNDCNRHYTVRRFPLLCAMCNISWLVVPLCWFCPHTHSAQFLLPQWSTTTMTNEPNLRT